MNIPLVDLFSQHEGISSDLFAAFNKLIETSAFIRGPQLTEFENAFAAMHGVDYAIGVASGTDALFLAAQAIGLKPGDEVVVPVNSWISTAFAASKVGAKPVLVDIDADTHQMDVGALEKAITKSTKAVFPVHSYGHPAPIRKIVDLCRQHSIWVVEDVAQAPLARLDGQLVGTFGDIACFSFYPSKNLGCLGDGGAVLTSDPELAHRIRCLADYGQSEPFSHRYLGHNSRLDTLQAAILAVKLPYLEDWTNKRRENAERYNRLFSNLPLKTPIVSKRAHHVYHLYVIEIERRDECLSFLRERSIMAQIHYKNLIYQQPCYSDLGYRQGDFPVAERVTSNILSLPMYPELTDNQAKEVFAGLSEFLDK